MTGAHDGIGHGGCDRNRAAQALSLDFALLCHLQNIHFFGWLGQLCLRMS